MNAAFSTTSPAGLKPMAVNQSSPGSYFDSKVPLPIYQSQSTKPKPAQQQLQNLESFPDSRGPQLGPSSMQLRSRSGFNALSLAIVPALAMQQLASSDYADPFSFSKAAVNPYTSYNSMSTSGGQGTTGLTGVIGSGKEKLAAETEALVMPVSRLVESPEVKPSSLLKQYDYTSQDTTNYQLVKEGFAKCRECSLSSNNYCIVCSGKKKVTLSAELIGLRDFIITRSQALQTDLLGSIKENLAKLQLQGKGEKRRGSDSVEPHTKQEGSGSLDRKLLKHSSTQPLHEKPQFKKSIEELEDDDNFSSEDFANEPEVDAIVNKAMDKLMRKEKMGKKEFRDKNKKTTNIPAPQPKYKPTEKEILQKTADILKVQSSIRKKTEELINVDNIPPVSQLIIPAPSNANKGQTNAVMTSSLVSRNSQISSEPFASQLTLSGVANNKSCCENCGEKLIVGKLYRCEKCEDFDFCENCYTQKDTLHDKDHKFVEINIGNELTRSGLEKRQSTVSGLGRLSGNRRSILVKHTYSLDPNPTVVADNDNLKVTMQLTNTGNEAFPSDTQVKCRTQGLEDQTIVLGNVTMGRCQTFGLILPKQKLTMFRKKALLDFELLTSQPDKAFPEFTLTIAKDDDAGWTASCSVKDDKKHSTAHEKFSRCGNMLAHLFIHHK
mgnify:CR=1 FL=1